MGKLESVIARKNIFSLFRKSRREAVKKFCSLIYGLCEGFFLNADYLLDVIALFGKFGVCAGIFIDNGIAYLAKERMCDSK